MLGVDKAVFYFLLGKGFSFIATPITLYFVATFLSPSEQGYYYTFYSLMGLSIFFELGLGVVICQFASHEYAGLSWSDTGGLKGEPAALSRIISLLRKSIKWYGFIAGLLVLCILPGGWFFLSSKAESTNVSYILPWILLVIFFGFNTCFIPILSALEGCGKVAQVQQLRLIQAVCSIVCVWIVFIAGGKLMVSPVEFIAYWSVILIWLFIRYRGFMRQILVYKVERCQQISWLKEVFPMQWKIAVSWVAAYFMGYLFVPLLFAYRGPVEAGKMGMSLKISGIVYVLSMAWINTRVPYYGALIQKKKYAELDRLALKSSLQALLVGLFFSVVAVTGLSLLERYVPKYSGRVLPEYIIVILCLANLANVATAAISGYLRAHKQEPLMVISVIMAVCVATTSFLAARYFDANIMAVLYTMVTVGIALPAFWSIMLKKRQEWHGR